VLPQIHGDVPSDPVRERARAAQTRYAPTEGRALGVLALVAVAALLWIIVPVGIGVLLGGLLAFTVHGYCRELTRVVRKRWVASLILTSGSTVGVAGTLAILAYLLVLQGLAVVSKLPETFAPGGPGREAIARLSGPLGRLGYTPDSIASRARDLLGNLTSSLAGWAAQIVGFVFDGALTLFFMALSMYFVLMRWTEFERKVEHLLPLNPNHSRRLMKQVVRLGRQTVIGNFGTALIQGLLAGVGFAIARVPEAAFLGAITAVAALVPAFGTSLVFVPVGLVLLFNGHAAAGIFVFAWSAVVIIGICDYFVRPRLVGRDETMSVLLTFVALFGGVKLFGFIGFLLGPLIAGLAITVLRMYARTRRFRLELAAEEPPGT